MSERRVKESRQITEYMVERFAKPVPLFSMVYTNDLIDYSRILRSSWISACCKAGTVVSSSCTLPYRVYIIISVSAKYSEAGGVLQINYL